MNYVSHFRKQLRLRQFDVCSKMGKTENWLSRVELGKEDPSVSEAVAIAKILNQDPETLFPSKFGWGPAMANRNNTPSQQDQPQGGSSAKMSTV